MDSIEGTAFLRHRDVTSSALSRGRPRFRTAASFDDLLDAENRTGGFTAPRRVYWAAKYDPACRCFYVVRACFALHILSIYLYPNGVICSSYRRGPI